MSSNLFFFGLYKRTLDIYFINLSVTTCALSFYVNNLCSQLDAKLSENRWLYLIPLWSIMSSMIPGTDYLGLNAGSFTYYLRYHYFSSLQTNIGISSIPSEDIYFLSTHQILAIMLFFREKLLNDLD